MTTWTKDELTRIGKADELKIASMRLDGTLRKPVIIWVVRVGDALYVRAVNGRTGLWFRHAQECHAGHIQAGGMSRDVSFVEAGEDKPLSDQIDAAYRAKYSRYGESTVKSTLTPEARSATIKLVPR
jgi:hypothetical protein